MAPEIINATEYKGYSTEVDVWAVGIIMYTLLIGQPPFEKKSLKATHEKILQNNYDFPKTPVISDSAKDLIRKFLVLKPD
jgi:serine/threonine protein kinase